MAEIKNALTFIHRMRSDADFRKELYGFKTLDDLSTFLSENNLYFSFGEFENAINSLKVEAPHEDAANEIDQIKTWWETMLFDLIHAEEGE